MVRHLFPVPGSLSKTKKKEGWGLGKETSNDAYSVKLDAISIQVGRQREKSAKLLVIEKKQDMCSNYVAKDSDRLGSDPG